MKTGGTDPSDARFSYAICIRLDDASPPKLRLIGLCDLVKGWQFSLSRRILLEQIESYRDVLEFYSKRLLPCIHWEPTENFNVRVLDDTGDFYRFFDATPHAEFIYECVKRTIEHDLPFETRFFQRYDAFRRQLEKVVDMPERTVDLLFRFLNQNGGILSSRVRKNEFAALTDEEVARIEAIHADHDPKSVEHPRRKSRVR